MIDLDDPQQVRQLDRLGLQRVAADPHLPEQALRAAAAGDRITYVPEVAGLARLAAELSALPIPAPTTGDAPPTLTFDTHPAYTLAIFLASSARIAGEPPPQLSVNRTWLHALRPETPAAANMAKQAALRLYQHVPLIWSGAPWLEGVGEEWRLRILYYAESAALAAGSEGMQRLWSMARFPNFWPNGVVVVHLAEQERPAVPGSEALAAILAARRIHRLELAAPGATRTEVAIHHLYLANWIALYLAALYQVDPADRVPLQLLGLA